MAKLDQGTQGTRLVVDQERRSCPRRFPCGNASMLPPKVVRASTRGPWSDTRPSRPHPLDLSHSPTTPHHHAYIPVHNSIQPTKVHRHLARVFVITYMLHDHPRLACSVTSHTQRPRHKQLPTALKPRNAHLGLSLFPVSCILDCFTPSLLLLLFSSSIIVSSYVHTVSLYAHSAIIIIPLVSSLPEHPA